MITASLVYWAYHYHANAARYRRRWGASLEEQVAQVRGYSFQRVMGMVLLGVVPVLVGWGLWGRSLGAYGVTLGVDWGLTALWVVGAYGVLGPLLWAAARGTQHQAMYPQMRVEAWTRALWVQNAGTWALYLLGYEVFFRGFLLVPMVEHFGVWPAIGVNTALYVYAHLPKDAGETLGCVVMGVVFALMALTTGGIWAPWLAHVLVAVSSEAWAVYHRRRAV